MHTSFLTLSHSDRYMTWHCSWKKISCSSILFTPTAPISHIRQRVDVSPGTISQRERRRFHARANFSSAQYFSDWKPDLNIFHWWTWPCIIFLQFKSQTMPEKFSRGPVQYNCPHLDWANLETGQTHKELQKVQTQPTKVQILWQYGLDLYLSNLYIGPQLLRYEVALQETIAVLISPPPPESLSRLSHLTFLSLCSFS